MIIRLTAKLAKRIKTKPAENLPISTNPYLDWTADLIQANHVPYIILTNTYALFSTIEFARGITNQALFVEAAFSLLRSSLTLQGFATIFHTQIAPFADAVEFSKTANASVRGAMNDIVYHSKVYIAEHGLSPLGAAQKVNEMPVGAIGYNFPFDAFEALKHFEVQPT